MPIDEMRRFPFHPYDQPETEGKGVQRTVPRPRDAELASARDEVEYGDTLLTITAEYLDEVADWFRATSKAPQKAGFIDRLRHRAEALRSSRDRVPKLEPVIAKDLTNSSVTLAKVFIDVIKKWEEKNKDDSQS